MIEDLALKKRSASLVRTYNQTRLQCVPYMGNQRPPRPQITKAIEVENIVAVIAQPAFTIKGDSSFQITLPTSPIGVFPFFISAATAARSFARAAPPRATASLPINLRLASCFTAVEAGFMVLASS